MYVPYKWNLWLRLQARFGHWEYEHEYKECPSGNRYCIHGHWRRGH